MPRYDKYDGKVGGFRAPLDFDLTTDDVGEILAVGLNANGRVVKGSGNTGVKAALIVNQVTSAGQPVDCMTDGEIVDCVDYDAGSNVFGAADGSTGDTATDTYLGHTVEAQRLVVRVAR